jgi:hypothetical protein
MAVQVRLMGEPNDIALILALLSQVAEVATDGRQYPNRSGFGVRVYAEVRASSGPIVAQAERVDTDKPTKSVPRCRRRELGPGRA